jgi:hypothetical protein
VSKVPPRDPRREAFHRLGGDFEVRVLEPSPPAVSESPWLADDPVARGDVPPGRTVVTPVAGGDLTWVELCHERGDPDLARWCADRWLGPWHKLRVDIPSLAATRTAWQALAEHVMAPARCTATGKIGLRWTMGGVGTPYFGTDHQLRLAGADLLVDGSPVPISTLRAAAEAVGITPGAPSHVYKATTPLDLDARLEVSAEAAGILGDWFGFGCSVLEELRATALPPGEPLAAPVAAAADDSAPSRVQLWPEHFDLSVEMGNEALSQRATFGASPGDEDHDTPYLYVVGWSVQPEGPPWNDRSFAGASLPWAELAGAEDQRGAALAFFHTCSAALRRGSGA